MYPAPVVTPCLHPVWMLFLHMNERHAKYGTENSTVGAVYRYAYIKIMNKNKNTLK